MCAVQRLTPESLAQYIDHTVLRPDATSEDISRACAEALQFGFYSVCIEAKWLGVAVPLLKGSRVLPITVIDFPLGNHDAAHKQSEAQLALSAGARELDMVLNREYLHRRDYRSLHEEIAGVVRVAANVPVKVILETSELEALEIIAASAIAKCAGARFVKTSTGFSKSGAREEDVRLMRQAVGPEMGVKASGGIRSYDDALRMIRAGASRIGASASVAMIRGASEAGSAY